MGRIRNKKIWLYFDRVSDCAARCKNCKLNLSCKHTSANLVRHLFYKHQVDASYHGAERTGFLKQKRVYKRSSVGKDVETPKHLPPLLALPESYEQVDIMKEEVIPFKLERCSSPDEDTHSVHDYQKSTRSPSPPHDDTPCIEGTNEQSYTEEDIFDQDMHTHNANLSDLHNAVSAQMGSGNSHLEEKLKAETRYYNEMAELARAKRIMVELQSKKLLLELGAMHSS